MPSVLEPDFARVESLALEAVQNGDLAPEQVEVLRSYFARLEKEVLAAYQADRNVASRMHDREKIHRFWERKISWFGAQFDIAESFDRILHKTGIIDLEPIKQSE